MKQLTCEMCGGTDLIKQDGVFVCQNCGVKYSVEEAKKMMVEGTVEVTGVVRVDNTDAIENYLKMAQHALESDNNKEAEFYANKIIEIAPQHSGAWEIKGQAAGWQSTIDNRRMPEAVSALLAAINFAEDDEKPDVRDRVAVAFADLFRAEIKLRTNNFAKIQSKENLNSIMSIVDEGVEMLNNLVVNGGIGFNRCILYDDIARMLNSSAVDGFNVANNRFGPDHVHMQDPHWKNFIASCDNCIETLKKSIEFVRERDLGETICSNIMYIHKAVCDSVSWRLDVTAKTSDLYVRNHSLTQSEKQERKQKIQAANNLKEFFKTNPINIVLERLKNERVNEEIKLARKKYWEDHQKELETLESEKNVLISYITELKKQLKAIPALGRIIEQKEAIDAYTIQLNSLGIFKGKEKKALQEKIDTCYDSIEQLEEAVSTERKPIDSEILKAESRIKEIEDEFTKDRGSTFSKGSLTIKEAIIDGKINVSPKQLIEHISNLLPTTYVFSKLIKSDSGFYEYLGNCYSVDVEYKSEDENEATEISINMYANSENDKAMYIVVQTSCNIDVKNILLWCRISSLIVLSLFNNVTQDYAEQAVAEILLDDETSFFVEKGLALEYFTYQRDFKALFIRSFDNLRTE